MLPLSDTLTVGTLCCITFALVFYSRILFTRGEVSAGRWQRQVGWIAGRVGHLIGRLVEAVLSAIIVGVFAALGWLDVIVVTATTWIEGWMLSL